MSGYLFALACGDFCLIVLAQNRQAGPEAIGLIFAAGGAGGLLGALVAPQLQKRARVGRALLILDWLFVLVWPLYAFVPGIWPLAAIDCAMQMIDQIHDVIWVSYRTALIPDALQGRVLSAYRLLSLGARPLGLALTGALLQRLGPAQTILAAAACLFALAVLTTLSRQVRQAR